MIELTPEQWQAITHLKTPTLIEPESKTAYVIVPKETYDSLRKGDQAAALILRVTWMRRMGLDENELTESLRDEPPTSVQEELKQIKALDNLDRITPSTEILRKYAMPV